MAVVFFFFFFGLSLAMEGKSALQWRWRVGISREVDERGKKIGEAAGREDGASLM